MPTPTVNYNSFFGANLEFANLGLHLLLAEIIKFRKQLTVRPDFNSQSGWNDALNHYMVRELENLSNTLENITYNPDDKTRDEVNSEAADTTRTLEQDYNVRALTADNVLLPAQPVRPVIWDLSGSDADIPQVNPQNCPNDFGRAFIHGLDNLFVTITRLDSRNQPVTITKSESAQVRVILNMLFTLCQRKGGEANKSDVPTGTLPSQEVKTFKG